jgi:hypothetical protein
MARADWLLSHGRSPTTRCHRVAPDPAPPPPPPPRPPPQGTPGFVGFLILRRDQKVRRCPFDGVALHPSIDLERGLKSALSAELKAAVPSSSPAGPHGSAAGSSGPRPTSTPDAALESAAAQGKDSPGDGCPYWGYSIYRIRGRRSGATVKVSAAGGRRLHLLDLHRVGEPGRLRGLA